MTSFWKYADSDLWGQLQGCGSISCWRQFWFVNWFLYVCPRCLRWNCTSLSERGFSCAHCCLYRTWSEVCHAAVWVSTLISSLHHRAWHQVVWFFFSNHFCVKWNGWSGSPVKSYQGSTSSLSSPLIFLKAEVELQLRDRQRGKKTKNREKLLAFLGAPPFLSPPSYEGWGC